MEAILKIQGMSCGHCVKAVKELIAEIEGINQVDVDLNSATAKVEYNQAKVSLDSILDHINSSNYTANL